MPTSEPGTDAVDVQRQLDELLWYHTIDVAPGEAYLSQRRF